MKIVIDLHEKDYQSIKNGHIPFNVLNAIMKGTPLPEHHGRLIDEQQIRDRFKPIEKFKHWRIGLDGLFNVLSDSPTIIEESESE